MSGQSDLERLQDAEQRLLTALEAAQRVVELLAGGAPQQELERLCSSFLDDVQASQVTLLQLADKHQQALPLQGNSYQQCLELLAAHTQVQAAEAQLAEAAAVGPAAGTGAVMQQQQQQPQEQQQQTG
ncbi:hypothetical protein ABPG77_006047 [Micractinium sp. CCAP 211/92]